MTCSGNQSDGVLVYDPTLTALVVSNLTGPITPTAGTSGVALLSYSDAMVDVAATIATANADGVPVTGRDNLNVTSVGNITVTGSSGRGIYAAILDAISTGSTLTITSAGNITTAGLNGHGIHAVSPTNGTVTIGSIGNITTTGYQAAGIWAENSAAGAINVTSTGNITTADTFSIGLLLWQKGIGDASVVSRGNITTSGFLAHGIFAQTDGGGSVSIDTSGVITTTGGDANGIYASSGGSVSITAAGRVRSDGGVGILALSRVKGNVTVNSSADIVSTQDAINAQAAIGDVNVASTGQLTTNFDGAAGISAVNHGTGNVFVSAAGTISTQGQGSHGVVAGSRIGDPDDMTRAASLRPRADAPSGQVFGVAATANITAAGAGSSGIYMHDTSGAATTVVDVLGVSVTGGANAGSDIAAGVYFNGAYANLLNNYGQISAASGMAVYATDGNVTINNLGRITGSVDVGGASVFNNLAGGSFIAGPTINLGAGGSLNNSSTLQLGAAGSMQTTSLVGDFVQFASGTYFVDANWTASTATRLNITGTAKLAGSVVVNPINFPTTGGLNQQFTILTASGGVTNNGITVANTAAVTNTLLFPNANDVVVSSTINFAPDAPAFGGTAIGQSLNSIVASGGAPGMDGLLKALMALPTQQGLDNALLQLVPSGGGPAMQGAVNTGQAFNNSLLSCRVAGDDSAAIVREGQCVWARGRAQQLTVGTNAEQSGYKERSNSITAGAQFMVGPNWRAGFALGYDDSSTRQDNGARSDGERYNAGAVLKYNPGPLLLAASLGYGWGRYDNSRPIAFAGFGSVATSNSNVDHLSARLHAAYLFDLGRWYLKPMIDGGPTRVLRGGYTEQGGGGAALSVQGSTQTVWSVSPAIEIGTSFKSADGTAWRPYLRVGATWINPAEVLTTASFAAAPAGASPFTVSTRIASTLFDVGAGIDVVTRNSAALRLQYDGRFGDDTRQHSLSLKASLPF